MNTTSSIRVKRQGLMPCWKGDLFIPEIGDWIRPKPGFRIFTTINPRTVGYVGRNTQDAANDDRFRFMYFDYMPEDQEISLIKSVLLSAGMKDEATAISTATCYREVAAAVRKAYMGVSDDAAALDVTLSTRSLVRWAKYAMACAGVSNSGFGPVHYALERSKTLKASPETRMAIHEMVHQVFGEEYRTPLTQSLTA
ncbi:CbbQ/NirQ/NorQ C-terminal domain-containing protein [Undibacterium arcticum]|uniref:CbbQ/NirQ/NorQ domain-containing protein n=1 Tax=Undibacterium arcticum TaxID=1762892 RepID=UPI003617C691